MKKRSHTRQKVIKVFQKIMGGRLGWLWQVLVGGAALVIVSAARQLWMADNAMWPVSVLVVLLLFGTAWYVGGEAE